MAGSLRSIPRWFPSTLRLIYRKGLFVFLLLLLPPPLLAQGISDCEKLPPELREKCLRMFEDRKVPQRASEQKVEKWEPAPLSREGLDAPARERWSDTGRLTRDEIAVGRKLLRERRSSGAFPEDETARTEVEAPPGEFFPEAKGVDKPAQVEKGTLKIFGHELFAWPASTFGPITEVPVSDDYVVGPGDEVRVLMWGRMDADYSLVVNAEGVIHLPKLGPLVVAGLTYHELKELIKNKAEAITGVNVDVTMGELRTIQVFVLGEVKSPGAYTVSSLSTISNTLLASGGPSQLGSLRQVQLKRGGRTIATLDFYDLLLRGDTSGDVRVTAGDVIFVPQVGPLVSVFGNVRRPAMYELKHDRTLQGAITLAGGLKPDAFNQRIQVERVSENRTRIVLDIPFAEHERRGQAMVLRDGDAVLVFPILERRANAVYLYGNVYRPGQYAYEEGMRLLDLIADERVLREDTYLSYALIKRYRVSEMKAELIPFDLGRLLFARDPGENFLLQPSDEVTIFNQALFQEMPMATIRGQVRFPGSYQIDKMRIKDLIYKAGGLTQRAYLPLGHLYRKDPKSGTVSLNFFNVHNVLKETLEDNLILQDSDEVVIHSIDEYVPPSMVTIRGHVNKPGDYPYASNMTMKDLIGVAGNVTAAAYLDEAEISRYQVSPGEKVRTEIITFNVRKSLAGDPNHDVVLRPYDQVFIKEIPGWLKRRTVTLRGEVRFPGEYEVRPSETLSSVLYRAGGFTSQAYPRGAVFVRESAREVQQQRLDELRERLQQEILRASSKEVQAALSKEDVEIQKHFLTAQEGLLKRLEQVRASGRVVIRLQPLPVFSGSEHDLALEDGDTLTVPSTPNIVTVIGQVYNPTAIVHDEKHPELKHYLAKTGGPTANAEESQIYVIRADGTVVSKGGSFVNWSNESNRWEVGGSFYSTRLYPGDTVLVPEKIIVPSLMRDVKDISQILFQIAVTAGVVAILF